MKRSLDGKVHCWEGLTEYKINQDDLLNSAELGIEGAFNIANNLRVNQYFTAETISSKIFATNYFDKYLNELRLLGLDIGKGDCPYGYKMPLPERGEERRKLIIFRRR
jgi:hypothetical protein